MTTDIIDINNYVVLISHSNSYKPIIEKCTLDEDSIGFTFYGSGKVELEIIYGNSKDIVQNTSGLAFSFYGNNKLSFLHKISEESPLKNLSIFSTIKNIRKLPKDEKALYEKYLKPLLTTNKNFLAGPNFYMPPVMQNVIAKIFNTTYSGTFRKMFLQSQITELLSHFFAYLSQETNQKINTAEKEKLFKAKDIITNNISSPPSLNELSKMIGLNNNKLKKNFKELFGVPVFKYLQNERLEKAFTLLKRSEFSTQEVAWNVGYESVSSFSNAFLKKYNIRPSEVNK